MKLKPPVLWKHRLLFGASLHKSFKMGVASGDQGYKANWETQVPTLAATQTTCVTASPHCASNPGLCNGDNSDGSFSGMCISEHTEKIRWCWGANGSYKYVWGRVLNRTFDSDTWVSESLSSKLQYEKPYAKNSSGTWTVWSRCYSWQTGLSLQSHWV